MLDLNVIRDETARVKAALAKRGGEYDIEGVLAMDARRRELIAKSESLRKERNENSRAVSQLKKSGGDASALIERTKSIGGEIKQLEADLETVQAKLDATLMLIPNLPAVDVPAGGPENNRELKHWGERRAFDFTPKPHWEIGEALDILDFPRATKVAEPHFALFKRAGARMVRALYSFMLDLHTTEHGYVEIVPPYLVNRAAMTGTGQLPKFEEDMYKTSVDDLFLIPTAEVPVTNILRDEILNEGELPVYYTAYTACFRREAGSYGADTRALLRVHQFDKVEMVKFVTPETSYDELEKLLANAETVLQRLGLEWLHRVCTEPRRLARRYLKDGFVFPRIVWREMRGCGR
jgi:seryl-tRNA synthetase